MIINRYIDLLKIIDNRQAKEINVTKEFYKWLKYNIGLDDDGNFYGIKLNIIEEKKKKYKRNGECLKWV